MGIFTKERLFKFVAAAKRHWWLFLPALLIITIGYAVFSFADSVLLLLLYIRNFFLKIYCAVKRGFKAFFGFIGKRLKAAGQKTSIACHKGGDKLREMNNNARTARDQILNDAVSYCTIKHSKRADKKARLRAEAKMLLEKTEIIPASPVLTSTESNASTAINKAAV